jgi:hypothetical protein
MFTIRFQTAVQRPDLQVTIRNKPTVRGRGITGPHQPLLAFPYGFAAQSSHCWCVRHHRGAVSKNAKHLESPHDLGRGVQEV